MSDNNISRGKRILQMLNTFDNQIQQESTKQENAVSASEALTKSTEKNETTCQKYFPLISQGKLCTFYCLDIILQ